MRKISYRYLFSMLSICVIGYSAAAQTGRGALGDDNEMTATGKTRALIVGISKYQYIDTLAFADKDAEAFSNFLSSNRFWHIPSEDIKILTNQNAKCGDIITELSRIIQVSKAGDRVIFYFSGHGDIENITQFKNGYLLAYDTYKNNYITGAVAVNFLKEVFLTLLNNDVKVFMFTDACHSGNLAGGLKGTEFATSAISAMWKNEIKILSSQPGQLSYEDKKWGNGRGVFSYYLTQGLAGAADENKDSLITLSELEMYVGKNVASATGNKQQPVFEGPNKFSTIISKVFTDNPPATKQGGSAYKKTPNSYGFDRDSCMDFYRSFTEAIHKNVIINNSSSALSWYKKIRSCSNDTDLVLRADSKLIAVLMDNTQQIVNNSLAGKKMATEEMYENGIQMLDAVLLNNDIKMPDAHIKNLRRYLYVSNEAVWNTGLASPAVSLHTIIDSALKDEPDAAYLLNAKGALYLRMNEPGMAIQALDKALQSSPTWLMPKYLLGMSYSKQNKYKKALSYFEEVLAKDPSFNTFECTKCIIQEMAELSEKINDKNGALKYYNKNLDLFPGYSGTYSGLSQLIIKTKNKRAADELIARLYKNNDSVLARITRIDLMMHFNKKDNARIEAAIDSIASIVRDRTDSADLEILWGTYYTEISIRYDEALDHFTNAMNLMPNDLYYISSLLDLLGDHEKYEEIESLVKEKLPNYASDDQLSLQGSLAMAYLGQGKPEEAFTGLKRLHEANAITCSDLKRLGGYLKRLPAYVTYMKNCKD